MNFGDLYNTDIKEQKSKKPKEKKTKERPMDGLTKVEPNPDKAHRVKDLARIMEGCVTGYEVTKCSRCLGRIDTGGNKDAYCRHCGARLENLYGRP